MFPAYNFPGSDLVGTNVEAKDGTVRQGQILEVNKKKALSQVGSTHGHKRH